MNPSALAKLTAEGVPGIGFKDINAINAFVQPAENK